MADFPEGAPCWVDAMFPDLEAGKRFYGELLGWTFEAGSPEYGNYTQAFSDGKNVAGVSPTMPGMEGTPPAWTVYLASPDVSATAEKITVNGGQVMMGPMEVGEFGKMLIAQDPGGVVFGVWEAGTHKGFQKIGEPGSFAWVEFMVRETGGVDSFYPAVYPLQTRQIGEGKEFDYLVLEAGGKPVAGRYKMDETIPAEVPSHALVYFAVDDCDDAVDKVRKLGGQVRTAARTTPFGRMAVVGDQQGAVFAVIDPSTTEGEPPM
ncbi:VOC family protein [Wenjunlia tyrosinilytica]|uniref:Hydrolase n=1 Tax=Wenjunlia tyrosinilytica TaxID=1544741 RepID=A0A918DWI6_9ACTN|nr:VOC family protein [Wenjunlia tyrosinilytica]GGO86745.1 hydrolase [Wenjunlia tyrosinilytica]